MQLLHGIRHRLLLIRYYSAPQNRTVWLLATQVSLLSALALCLPAAWIADQSLTQPGHAMFLSGYLYDDRGELLGIVMTGSRMAIHDPSVHATFFLQFEESGRGWPFESTRSIELRRTDIQYGADPNLLRDVALSDEERDVIATLFGQEGEDDLAAAIRGDDVLLVSHHSAWAGNALAWCGLLFATACVLILLVRLTSSNARRHRGLKRAIREGAGQCPSCGYDMHGLEFSERCPECGTVV